VSAALRDRTVRLVAVLYGCSILIEWAVGIALMITVYVATASAAAAALMLVSTQLVPNVGLALYAKRLDSLGARQVFIVATLVQALGVIAVGLFGHGPELYVAAIFVGIGSSAARAQLRTALARVPGPADLVRTGNALLGVVRGPVSLAGPALGGLSVAVIGASASLLVFGAALAGLAALALMLPALLPRRTADDAPVSAGWQEARRRPSVLPVAHLLALVAIVACVFSIDEPVLIAYADRALGAGPTGYSALFVAWGAGLLIGSLAFSRMLTRPMLTVFCFGLFLNVLGHVGLVVAPSLPLALAAAALGGIGNGIDWSALATAVQEAAPEGAEASVAGRLEAFSTVGIGVGVALGGVVADFLGPRVTLAIPAAGGAVIILVLACCIGWVRSNFAASPRHLPSIQGGVS
jgi:predicted MFS family arabinose efflux permease